MQPSRLGEIMLTVWGRKNSINVQKVMWTIGELGIDHERIDAGGTFGGLDAPEYRAMNPNGKIPVIVDEGAVVWESNAIVRYLAARYGAGSLWPEHPAARAEADRWMDWMVTTPYGDLITVFRGLIRTPPEERDDDAIESAVKRLGDHWRVVDAHLADRPFIAGDALTMGDIPVGAACYRYLALDIARPSLPHIEAWYGRLEERPPYRDHVMLPLS